MSNQLNISMDQGSSLDYRFTIKSASGAAYNLIGHNAQLQVRRSYGDVATVLDCTQGNGRLIYTDAANGQMVLTLSPTDTSSIRFNSRDDDALECVYDLEITRPDGRVFKPAKGVFTFYREVTR